MNCLKWLLILPALWMAGPALAQVATTDLVPAAPRYFRNDQGSFNRATLAADNPAAIAWSKPARAAFGLVNVDTSQPQAGTSAAFSGYFVGYRGMKERLAYALQHLAVDGDSNSSLKETATAGHVAYQVAEVLALGAGLDLAESSFYGGLKNTVEANTIGASLNLAKSFYFGYAIGRDRYETSTGITGARDTTMLGVAVRAKGGWDWHIGYDKLDKDNFDNGVGLGYDATTFTLQVLAGDWVVGAQRVTKTGKGSSNPFHVTVVDAGYAPQRGMSLTGRYASGQQESGGAVSEKARTVSVIIGYGF